MSRKNRMDAQEGSPVESELSTEQGRVRKVPTQQRSRERVERILEIATSLIVQQGSDAMRMSEVATLAGISIGSLYQYFPDKTAIIRTLAERHNASGVACVEQILGNVRTRADLTPALLRVIEGYYAMLLQEPVMRDVWRAMQGDKRLQELEDQDAATHSQMLQAVLTRLYPHQPAGELAAFSQLTMHLIASAVRLAISLDRKAGDELMKQFKTILPFGMIRPA